MNKLIVFVLGFSLLYYFEGCSLEPFASPKSSSAVYRSPFQRDFVFVPRTDSAVYDSLLLQMANNDTGKMWPPKHKIYPRSGAILPYKRIIAFYGNLYSQHMGILGALPPEEMLKKLDTVVKNWEAADPSKPVQPALQLVTIVAHRAPQSNKKYITRMPDQQIDSVLMIASKRKDMIVFLDIQVGWSNVQTELPLLHKYLSLPNVHLGIDPEFSMKKGGVPGKRVGTYDAEDINFCINYLSNLVKWYDLPPKVLVVHRFTKNMVTNVEQIKPTPQVQFVMDMDGWGNASIKKNAYQHFIYREPVQFTGFKLFFKNDIKIAPHSMLSPNDIANLNPIPLYIQYQ